MSGHDEDRSGEPLVEVRGLVLSEYDVALLCDVARVVHDEGTTLAVFLGEVEAAVLALADEADEEERDEGEVAAALLLESAGLLADSHPEIAAGLERAARERVPQPTDLELALRRLSDAYARGGDWPPVVADVVAAFDRR
jgi:hypothetical protein